MTKLDKELNAVLVIQLLKTLNIVSSVSSRFLRLLKLVCWRG